jgi:flagellar hook assembly protein FlgD
MFNENETGQESISLERDAFSPDGDGLNDVLYLHYNFGEPGYVANITLFDAKGRFVRTLASNELMAPEGVVAWDGTSETGQKAAIGIYIIHIEVFNLQGEVKKYRKVCAVNGRLD